MGGEGRGRTPDPPWEGSGEGEEGRGGEGSTRTDDFVGQGGGVIHNKKPGQKGIRESGRIPLGPGVGSVSDRGLVGEAMESAGCICAVA